MCRLLGVGFLLVVLLAAVGGCGQRAEPTRELPSSRIPPRPPPPTSEKDK